MRVQQTTESNLVSGSKLKCFAVTFNRTFKITSGDELFACISVGLRSLGSEVLLQITKSKLDSNFRILWLKIRYFAKHVERLLQLPGPLITFGNTHVLCTGIDNKALHLV